MSQLKLETLERMGVLGPEARAELWTPSRVLGLQQEHEPLVPHGGRWEVNVVTRAKDSVWGSERLTGVTVPDSADSRLGHLSPGLLCCTPVPK